MEEDVNIIRALIEAGNLLRLFGQDAPGEAMLRSIDCELAKDLDGASFWSAVERETMDALIAVNVGRTS